MMKWLWTKIARRLVASALGDKQASGDLHRWLVHVVGEALKENNRRFG